MLNYIKIKLNIVKFRGKKHNKNTEKRDKFRYIKRNEQLLHV